MFTDDGLKLYYERLKLSEAARKLIDRIRKLGVARQVHSTTKSAIVAYQSRKMGWTVTGESATVEFPKIIQLEHGDYVLEYYDQPNKLKLVFISKSGRKTGCFHTPDFFVLLVDAAGWIECKSEQELERLSQESPNRYIKSPDGTWRCPPGEEAAAEFGLFYKVWSSAEISWQFHNNMLFLDDYFRPPKKKLDEGNESAQEEPEDPDSTSVKRKKLDVSDEAAQEVVSLVTKEPGIMLRELIERVKVATSDDINLMIIHGEIYIDLFTYQLHEPELVPVFYDHWTAKAQVAISTSMSDAKPGGYQNIRENIGEIVTWNDTPYMILNKTDTSISLRCETEREGIFELSRDDFRKLIESGKIVGSPDWIEGDMSAEARERLATASPEELEAAYQ